MKGRGKLGLSSSEHLVRDYITTVGPHTPGGAAEKKAWEEGQNGL